MALRTSTQTTDAAEQGLHSAATSQVAGLRGLVAELDPDLVAGADAAGLWDVFDSGEKLCAAAKTLLARRVEDSGVWREAGMRSPAEYLALRGGTTREVARRELATSKNLVGLGILRDALRRGELSGAQAYLIADAADHAPAYEAELLGHAKVVSHKELKDECLRKKVTADPKPENTRKRIYDKRYFRLSTDAEGAWSLSGRGPLDHAGSFGAALNPLIDHLYQLNHADGRNLSREALSYDAIQELGRLGRAMYYGYDYDTDDYYHDFGPGRETHPNDSGDVHDRGGEERDVAGAGSQTNRARSSDQDAGTADRGDDRGDTSHDPGASTARDEHFGRTKANDDEATDKGRSGGDGLDGDARPPAEPTTNALVGDDSENAGSTDHADCFSDSSDDDEDEDYPYTAASDCGLFDDLWDDGIYDYDDEDDGYPHIYSELGDDVGYEEASSGITTSADPHATLGPFSGDDRAGSIIADSAGRDPPAQAA